MGVEGWREGEGGPQGFGDSWQRESEREAVRDGKRQGEREDKTETMC